MSFAIVLYETTEVEEETELGEEQQGTTDEQLNEEQKEGGTTGVGIDSTIISDSSGNSYVIQDQEQLFNDKITQQLSIHRIQEQQKVDNQVSQLFQTKLNNEISTVEVFVESRSIPEARLEIKESNYSLWLVIMVVVVMGVLVMLLRKLFKMEEME